MIKKLFLPEKIGSYYLFDKQVVGIDIGPQVIHAAVVRLKGNTKTIEKLLEEPLSLEGGTSHDERIVNALRTLSNRLGSYDELVCTLPSSLIVFKTLTLPFTGLKKIKMVVPFEVEPLLPFTLDQAALDSIVTYEDNEKQQSTVFVSATKKEFIDRYSGYFAQAGLTLHKLSVDMIELYGAYKLIETKKNPLPTVGIIDMEFDATRIALIHQGQLISIRSLPEGIISVARTISSSTHTDIVDTMQSLVRSGVDKTRNTHNAVAVENALSPLTREIGFSYTTALTKLEPAQPLSSILLVGPGADIPGIGDFFKQELEVPVRLLEPKKLIHNAALQSNVSTLPNSYMLSIATALAPDLTHSFNLYQEQALKEETNTITTQLIMAAALFSLILGSFITYSFFRVRALRQAYKQSQQEALSSLQRNFKLKPSQTITLAQANRAAQTELKKEEETWQRLSNENRYLFLRALSELSKCITLKDTQLDITSLVITDTVIRLYGSVPGYPQLAKLQSQLECPFFKRLPKLQDWNFKSEPITLTINKEEL